MRASHYEDGSHYATTFEGDSAASRQCRPDTLSVVDRQMLLFPVNVICP